MENKLKLNSIVNDDCYMKDYIKEMVDKSNRIDIIVSFIRYSGVKELEKEFRYIAEKNIPIRILTSTYLNITEPSALYLLKDLMGSHGDIRVFDDDSISFHPKAYFFYTNSEDYIIVGSSNISKSALSKGIEWNYRLSRGSDKESFKRYETQFDQIIKNKSIEVNDEFLKSYSKNWIKPKVDLYSETIQEEAEVYNVSKIFQPNASQVEALYELKKIRDEGADKAIVVAATGVGKTYLAAFDAMKFKKVLFIAHREEILKQAYNTFKSLNYRSLGILNGQNKDYSSEVVFASIQTISKEENLRKFDKDCFDYIVVDEFHHSAAGTYKSTMNYFKPKFMLGLTATPYRMDNQDIFALLDYNVAYESDLFTSINKGWLVPFYYYGIYDHTVNYDNITYIKGKYQSSELDKNLNVINRCDLILEHFLKHRRKRTLGFCSSIKHADFMSKYFNDNNIKAMAVHSESSNREEAIEKITNNDIEVIFSVDMFNEGLDVKEIDLVMFLRPTESPIVFLQQLGRGLRLHENKNHLAVLDFIGNYKKVSLIPFLLSGKSRDDYMKHKIDISKVKEESYYPEGCRIEFDFQIINLFEKYNRERTKLSDLILDEFNRIREELGYIPSRIELFTLMKNDIYKLMKRNSKLNIFRDYTYFISKYDDNSKALLDTFAHEFIKMIETTSMAKLYKLPIFLAFYNEGNIKDTIDEDDIYQSFKDFYSNGQNGLDMIRDKSTKGYKEWDKAKYVNLAFRNPINFLGKTHWQFFKEIDKRFVLNSDLISFYGNEEFRNHFRDAIEMRRVEFLKARLIRKE